jgi:hypothetical protein
MQSYACINCGGAVETGRARLAAVACHSCADAERVASRMDDVTAHMSGAGTLATVENEIAGELYRSRRYQRPLTLVAIGLASLNGQRATVVSALRGLRATDRVWDLGDRVLVLLPETDRDGAEQFLERVVSDGHGSPVQTHAAVATFPDDALTGTGLLAAVTDGAGAASDEILRPLGRVAARFRRDAVGTEMSA